MSNEIIAKGFIYEYGKLYLDPDTGIVGTLQEYSEELEQFRIETALEYLDCDKLVTVDHIAGTIKEAPLIPIEGRWYMCEWPDETRAVLEYKDGSFGIDDNCVKPILEMVEKER